MGADIFNSSAHFNVSATSMTRPRAAAMGPSKTIIQVIYVVGILGNLAAIVYLRIGKRKVRNNNHLLLLTALAVNDLVAMVGSISMMLVGEFVPGVMKAKWLCAMRVVMRIFGFGSGCIAVTMALERYLALIRPCFYLKNMSYRVVCSALLVFWSGGALLTCAPILGVGLYYSESEGCLRYRNADSMSTTQDFAYAVTYVVFGTLMCVILAYCNTAVIRELCAITRSGRPQLRRIAKSQCEQNEPINAPNLQAGHKFTPTTEEVTFSRLIATLSVVFIICWLPQMLTSALFLALGRPYWQRLTPLGMVSDLLMLINYVLNPVLYVLMCRPRPFSSLRHFLRSCFKRKCKVVEPSGPPPCLFQGSLETQSSPVSSDISESLPLRHFASSCDDTPLPKI